MSDPDRPQTTRDQLEAMDRQLDVVIMFIGLARDSLAAVRQQEETKRSRGKRRDRHGLHIV